MRLEELVNSHYNKLNENDLLIWKYIQGHKRECCDIAIEDLAQKCAISRTTISRFTQKLSFVGFREFKLHLKMECEEDQGQSRILLDEVCAGYEKSIQAVKETDMTEICEHIYSAKRLFVFGTGETQNAAAQLIKRMFMTVKRFFVTLYGMSELTMAMEDLGPEDLVIIISLSGETKMAVSAAKTLKAKGVYTVSITRLSDNTVARLCDKNIYIQTKVLLNKAGVTFEACSAYFNVAELLCVKYLLYTGKKSSED